MLDAISNRLVRARKKAGYTNPVRASEAMRPAVRVSYKTIYEYEAGRSNPSAVQLARLCRHYKVSADHILGLD